MICAVNAWQAHTELLPYDSTREIQCSDENLAYHCVTKKTKQNKHMYFMLLIQEEQRLNDLGMYHEIRKELQCSSCRRRCVPWIAIRCCSSRGVNYRPAWFAYFALLIRQEYTRHESMAFEKKGW